MKIKLLFISLIIFFFSSIVSANARDTIIAAFKDGEKLSYDVKYSSALFTSSIADVVMDVKHEGTKYKITAIGKTRPFYGAFFEIEDVYHSWIDVGTMRPLRTTSKIKEGGYQYRTAFDYNWSNNIVHTLGQNIKRGTTYTKAMPLKEDSFDALALFYNMRCVDMAMIVPHKRYKLNLVLEDTIRVVEYRLLGPDITKINKVGKFRTLKVACTIATESGDALKDGSEFYIWLSDDKNRIPIYMESPIRVGSIKVYLNKWEGLRYPFTAKLTD